MDFDGWGNKCKEECDNHQECYRNIKTQVQGGPFFRLALLKKKNNRMQYFCTIQLSTSLKHQQGIQPKMTIKANGMIKLMFIWVNSEEEEIW